MFVVIMVVVVIHIRLQETRPVLRTVVAAASPDRPSRRTAMAAAAVPSWSPGGAVEHDENDEEDHHRHDDRGVVVVARGNRRPLDNEVVAVTVVSSAGHSSLEILRTLMVAVVVQRPKTVASGCARGDDGGTKRYLFAFCIAVDNPAHAGLEKRARVD